MSSPLVDYRFVKWVGVGGFLHQRLEVVFCHQTYFPQFPLLAIAHLYLKKSLPVHFPSEAGKMPTLRAMVSNVKATLRRWCRM
jgi:hypothetical protein